MTEKTTAYIGDIHGCDKQLGEILDQLLPIVQRLVFLGDYVNRGPSSRLVIDRLVALSAVDAVETKFLRGNHDLALLEYVKGGEVMDFLMMGGANTIRSYVARPHGDVTGELRRLFPVSHLAFLESLEEFDDDGSVFASHEKGTGLFDRFVVFGHNVQPALAAKLDSDSAAIDTGCGTSARGRLSALLWPQRVLIQSSPWDSENDS